MIVDILEVREKLQTTLETLGSEVSYENVGDNTVFPYIVFNLPDSNFDGANSEFFTLDVDGWDEGIKTIALETLMHKVNLLLEKKSIIINNDLGFRTVLDRRLSLNDSDNNVLRRKYIYQLRLFR